MTNDHDQDQDQYWGQPGDTRHIFHDDQSLCGRWYNPAVDLTEVTDTATYQRETDCHACCRAAGLLEVVADD